MSVNPLTTIPEHVQVQFTVRTSINIDAKQAKNLTDFLCKINPIDSSQNAVNIPNGTSMMIIENKDSLSFDKTGINFIVPKGKHSISSDKTLRFMHSIDLSIEEIEKIKRIFVVKDYPSTAKINFPEGTSIEVLSPPSSPENISLLERVTHYLPC